MCIVNQVQIPIHNGTGNKIRFMIICLAFGKANNISVAYRPLQVRSALTATDHHIQSFNKKLPSVGKLCSRGTHLMFLEPIT